MAVGLISQLPSLSGASSYIAGRPGDVAASSVAMDYTPPHLRGRPEPPSVTSAPPVSPSAVRSTTDNVPTGYIPPHLRGIRGTASVVASRSDAASRGGTASATSASNQWQDRESITNSSQTVGDPGIVYNAYDPAGQLHTKRRLPSETTTETAAPLVAPPPAAATRTDSAAISQTRRANGNWARAVC